MTSDAAPLDLPGLDAASVQTWMAEHVAGLEVPVSFDVIAGGHSNITYGATDAAGHTYVVRRPPLGSVGGRAHDMGREFRVITALAPTSVPVPQTFALCEDTDVNEATFYVMEYVRGHVLDNPKKADDLLPGAASRQRAGEQIVDVLADIHQVDVDSVGLGEAARREDYLTRQLSRFRTVWDQNKTRELPAIEEVANLLTSLAPPQKHTGIVHGDYRIGNVMVDETGTLVAVLDWELWTLGDVLADLGFLLTNWYEPDDPAPLVFMEWPPTISGDFGGRDDVIERYAQRTGFDVSAVEYYRAFQYWKVAVLAEGVKRRYETAQMASADVDFDHLDRRVLDLVDLARHHLASYRA